MTLSQTTEMQGQLLEDAFNLTLKTLHDAQEDGFNPEVFPWAVNAQLQTILKQAKRLNEAMRKDAEYLENRMRNAKEPDEYGRDAETGRIPGRYLGLAKE